MNKFTLFFLLLFFAATLALGVYALKDTLSLKGEAVLKCPNRQIPGPNFCLNNKAPLLEKDTKGCLQFVCK